MRVTFLFALIALLQVISCAQIKEHSHLHFVPETVRKAHLQEASISGSTDKTELQGKLDAYIAKQDQELKDIDRIINALKAQREKLQSSYNWLNDTSVSLNWQSVGDVLKMMLGDSTIGYYKPLDCQSATALLGKAEGDGRGAQWTAEFCK